MSDQPRVCYACGSTGFLMLPELWTKPIAGLTPQEIFLCPEGCRVLCGSCDTMYRINCTQVTHECSLIRCQNPDCKIVDTPKPLSGKTWNNPWPHRPLSELRWKAANPDMLIPSFVQINPQIARAEWIDREDDLLSGGETLSIMTLPSD